MLFIWFKGGVEKRIYEITKRLADRGHGVTGMGLDGGLKIAIVK